MTRYQVKVVQTVEAVEVVEVEAVTPEEAIDLAKEAFQFYWESAAVLKTEAASVEEVRDDE